MPARRVSCPLAALALLAAACDCEPPVAGVLASDTLPEVDPGGATELSYRLTAPQSGDLMVELTRTDARTDHAGAIFLFVTGADCTSLTSDPFSLRDFDIFSLRCSTLANSIAVRPRAQGTARLAAPARVRRGQALKVFVYALSTPYALPVQLSYAMGDPDCIP